MPEIINVDFKDLTSMSEAALDFFADELNDKNTISINTDDGSVQINTLKEWDDFLKKQNLVKPVIKKDVRI
ncbi:MAG: hypothetical protein NE334_16950 [Lentisphaeraceae bacterium]|nr:hypothetical protein [Lentisphaeraceae bacterium]